MPAVPAAAAVSGAEGVTSGAPSAASISDCVKPDAAAAALAIDISVAAGAASEGGVSAGVASDDARLEGAGASANAGEKEYAGEEGQHARMLPAVQATLPEPVVQAEVGS